MAQLGPNDSRRFLSPFTGGVICMDLDKTEDRFLLAGGADTTISLYDTHTGSENVGRGLERLVTCTLVARCKLRPWPMGRTFQGGPHLITKGGRRISGVIMSL